MSNTHITDLIISYTKRTARARGPTSSEAWNDNADELVRDLTAIANQWNDLLVPLLATVPDGNNDLNAYEEGLDGRTILVNSLASEGGSYYNTSATRPYSVYEQFQAVYSYVDSNVNTVQSQVDNISLSSENLLIIDEADLFAATTVEGALQEIMQIVAVTGANHSALSNLSSDDHSQYLPRTGTRGMTGNLSMGGQAIVMTSNVKWLTGTGAPNGVVTAEVGSLYTRTDGGVNTTLYVKETGSTSVGWTAK